MDQDYKLLPTLSKECYCFAFMPDGKLIVTGWNDGKIRGFLPQSGKLKFEINNAHNKVLLNPCNINPTLTYHAA